MPCPHNEIWYGYKNLLSLHLKQQRKEAIKMADSFHFSVNIILRGKGKSAVASAAYISGEKNEWDGVTHDYTKKLRIKIIIPLDISILCGTMYIEKDLVEINMIGNKNE